MKFINFAEIGGNLYICFLGLGKWTPLCTYIDCIILFTLFLNKLHGAVCQHSFVITSEDIYYMEHRITVHNKRGSKQRHNK